MTWTVTRRDLGPDIPREFATLDDALKVVCSSMPNLAGTGAELAIRGDGGWTEAPTPTTCWDPRAAAPERVARPQHGLAGPASNGAGGAGDGPEPERAASPRPVSTTPAPEQKQERPSA